MSLQLSRDQWYSVQILYVCFTADVTMCQARSVQSGGKFASTFIRPSLVVIVTVTGFWVLNHCSYWFKHAETPFFVCNTTHLKFLKPFNGFVPGEIWGGGWGVFEFNIQYMHYPIHACGENVTNPEVGIDILTSLGDILFWKYWFLRLIVNVKKIIVLSVWFKMSVIPTSSRGRGGRFRPLITKKILLTTQIDGL